MKQIKYIIAAITVLIAFICTLYNSCIDSYDLDKTKEFVNKHGGEDFSIFVGVNPMFYRGQQDTLYLLGGIIPGTDLAPNMYSSPAYQTGSEIGNSSLYIIYELNDYFKNLIRTNNEGQ